MTAIEETELARLIVMIVGLIILLIILRYQNEQEEELNEVINATIKRCHTQFALHEMDFQKGRDKNGISTDGH